MRPALQRGTLPPVTGFARILLLGAILGQTACSAVVLEGIDEPEANALVDVLQRVGLPAEKAGSKNRHQVTVPKGALGPALRVSRAAGFPRQPTRATAPAGLVLTPTQVALRARAENADALELLLRARPGVVDATVILQADRAAVVVRTMADAEVEPAPFTALVRHGAALPPDALIEIQVEPLPAVDWSPDSSASQPALLGGLTAVLAALCLGLLVRLRRLRRA